MNDQSKRPRTFVWCIALATALLAYPASFGPACWLSERTEDGRVLSVIYGPVIRIAFAHKLSSDVGLKYLMWGVRRNAFPAISIRAGRIRWTAFSFVCGPPDTRATPNRFIERPIEGQFNGGFGGAMGRAPAINPE